ncbi:MAG: filamentous hemagglutinin, partial [Acidobacteria bacterium]
RAYGQTNPVFSATFEGFVNGETTNVLGGTLVLSTTAETNSPVGVYPIEVTGVTSSNYDITFQEGTLTVTPYALTVKADDKQKVYGQSDPAFTVSYTGFVNGQTESVLGGTLAFSRQPGEAVSSYTITPSGLTSSNYAITFATGTLTISKATLSVTPADASRVYGDANPVFTGNIVGIQNSDNITANYTTTATATSPVASYPITATLNDPDNKLGNYTVTLNSGTLSVTRAPLAVTAAGASRLYGDANPVFNGTITGIRNSDNITASYNTSATSASAVGSYDIVPTLNDPDSKLSNYDVTDVTLHNGTLTINAAPLSISADNKSRSYGAANPSFTGSITGTRNSDNLSLSYNTSATANSPVGSYAIVPSVNDPDH